MKWTNEEINFLKNNYPQKTVTEISEILGRKRESVDNKLRKIFEIKIKKNDPKLVAKNKRLYRIWQGIKYRCINCKCRYYNNYGGRGISVCESWMLFDNFYYWAMNNGYTDDLTIDRIDVNGNYCPENCRWITNAEQQSNTRKNVYLTAFGETKTLTEWSRDSRCKISRSKLSKRISLGKLSIEESITLGRQDTSLNMTAFGETKNLRQWSLDSRCRVCYETLYARFKSNKMSPEDMIQMGPCK